MRLSEATVVISGLGLMGASLAMALRGKCRDVVGVARRADAREAALRLGIVDRAIGDLANAASEADIVVLATPARSIIQAIPDVAARMRPGALLFDLGSTKRGIVGAMNSISEGVMAVGGHPMCGKELGGLDNADPQLFAGAMFVLTPTERATEGALALASEIVTAVGARPCVLDAERHDRAVAVISHLPYLLAATLMHTKETYAQQDHVVEDLAASGFRDTTRLAMSEPDMMLDILLTNTQAVRASLSLFMEQLADMLELLDRPDALKSWMLEAQAARKGMFR